MPSTDLLWWTSSPGREVVIPFAVEHETIPVILSDRSAALSCAEGGATNLPPDRSEILHFVQNDNPKNSLTISWKEYRISHTEKTV